VDYRLLESTLNLLGSVVMASPEGGSEACPIVIVAMLDTMQARGGLLGHHLCYPHCVFLVQS
jgi:hypothetical protein